MITVKNLIEHLNKLVKENPEAINYPVIYSSDDEGNSFHHAIGIPALTQVEFLGEHYLEMVGVYDEDSDKIVKEDCNCVIIN